MTFSLGGTEIRITWGAVLLPAFCIAAGETKALLCALFSLAVHEAAHAVAAHNLGFGIARIGLYAFGAVMRLADETEGRGEWIIAAAGPLGSLTVAGLLRLFQGAMPAQDVLSRLVETNLLIAFVNLLPAFPLDGGRLFRALLRRVMRERAARTLLLVFTAVIAAGAAAAGIVLIRKGVPAWTLIAVPPFLIASAVSEWRMPDAGTISRVMRRNAALKHGTAQKAEILVLPDSASVGDAMTAISDSRYTILRVAASSGAVELTEAEILRAAAKFGMHAPLKSVISRLTERK